MDGLEPLQVIPDTHSKSSQLGLYRYTATTRTLLLVA